MTKNILSPAALAAIFFLVVFAFASCSSGDDNFYCPHCMGGGNEPQAPTDDRIAFTVKAGNRSYDYKYLETEFLNTDMGGNPLGVFTFDGKSAANDYGSYDGGILIFSFWLKGQADYALSTDHLTFSKSSGRPTMYLTLTLGAANASGRRTYIITGDPVKVTVVDDKYHITLDGTFKGTAIGPADNISELPKEITFTAQDLYDHN